MYSINGELSDNHNSCLNNRAFLYGDAVFETFKISNGKVLFLEDHYFRLMASMRVLRMKIPANFTLEYFEAQLLNLARALHYTNARMRCTVFRNDGGKYLPHNRTVSYIIEVEPLDSPKYVILESNYEVDIYKDFYVTSQLLSNLKTTNRVLNVTGSIFAEENDLQNCILLNQNKNVVEFLNGNLFLLINHTLVTPPLSEGCINGIMRKQVLNFISNDIHYKLEERTVSPFELQNADELFLTNVMCGIQPVTKYKKKIYTTTFAQDFLAKINESI